MENSIRVEDQYWQRSQGQSESTVLQGGLMVVSLEGEG